MPKAGMCAILFHEISMVHGLTWPRAAGVLNFGGSSRALVSAGLSRTGFARAAHGKQERRTMVSRQLELGFGIPGVRQPAGWRRRGSGRASWGFERMRGAVSDAGDSEHALSPPPGVQSGPVDPGRKLGDPDHVTRE
jgi:hypothetical protein